MSKGHILLQSWSMLGCKKKRTLAVANAIAECDKAVGVPVIAGVGCEGLLISEGPTYKRNPNEWHEHI